MKKTSAIHDFDLASIPRTWNKAVGSPLGSAAALGLMAGVPTYFAAPWMLGKVYQHVLPRLPAGMRAELEEEMRTKLPSMKWKLAGGAAALAAGLSLAHNWNPKYPWKSLARWNYAEPDNISKENAEMLMMPGMRGEAIRSGQLQVMPGDRPVFPSGAGINPDVVLETIPFRHSRELVFHDPFMNDRQKGQAGAIFDNTGYNTETGRTSIASLAAGAMRAGFGLAGGVLAGHVVGKLFSLPMPVTRALSVSGGIAGTLINTGVVR